MNRPAWALVIICLLGVAVVIGSAGHYSATHQPVPSPSVTR